MSAREIDKLRYKFIRIAMLSILLTMVFISSMVNVFTWSVSRNTVYRVLDALITSAEEGSGEYSIDIKGNNTVVDDLFSPEYQKNHYYVFRTSADEALSLLFSNVKDDDEMEALEECVGEIYSDGKSRGRYGSYYYEIKTEPDGTVIMAILEGSAIISTERMTFRSTLVICMLGLILTFFLVRHFSEAAVRPEIENSMRQKQFITNASHELKTPLAVIRANTEMIEVLNGESEWTTSTLNQVDHLNGLIQNLVMIARSQENEDRSEMTEIDAAKAVSETIAPYELMAEQSGKTIVRDIEAGLTMHADDSKIRQLAALLIDNAMKYCDDGGTVTVSLVRSKNGKNICLTVSNDYKDGADIDCNRFFDRFYREDASHNIDKGGYGIGLSIAESICQQYSGSIRAEWSDGVISFICELKA